ncbi:DUF1624 domain-containing protein, partial [Agrobacterium sp.]|uniref:DUF1624 domain-containing protein n=1 Tax=Agrobacterium sp. TaxID=361 RepID=UPI0028AE2063
WDLELFGYLEPGTATQGLWKIYARGIASSFLFLAGFSLYLAHSRGINWPSFRKRFAMIAAAAVVITVATAIATPEGMIFFGILHNIAAASLIGLLFLRLPIIVTLIVAAAALAAPFYLTADIFSTPWLLWVGLSPVTPRSNDYVPILPWLTPFLLGLTAAKIALPAGWLDRFRTPSHPRNPLALAGKHSLAFYLIHQPILVGLVYLASLVAPPPPVDMVEEFKKSCERTCVSGGNSVEMCQSFCGCTLERLQAENIFDNMMASKLSQPEQVKIEEISLQCTRQVQ